MIEISGSQPYIQNTTHTCCPLHKPASTKLKTQDMPKVVVVQWVGRRAVNMSGAKYSDGEARKGGLRGAGAGLCKEDVLQL